jgi:ATP-dependent protease ClpP protease subunit
MNAPSAVDYGIIDQVLATEEEAEKSEEQPDEAEKAES